MNAASNNQRNTLSQAILRRVFVLTVCFLAIAASGCTTLRLPAIDPTGSCLFSPLPTTTSLALPGSAGEGCGCLGCINNLGNCLSRPDFSFPTPAFVTPADPPACLVPGTASTALGATNQPCVPSAPCNGSCSTGPRAVLLGSEIGATRRCQLPTRGKRGCILLSPQKIVAPVGGEVVLMSGVCGTDGYLQMNEKLEWMLTPDSVGTFIQVGDDDPGVIGKLVGSQIRPDKRDPGYAIGVTSTKRSLITRGNLDPSDDVQLEKGQTWLTLSSPSEGVSHVTVLAPESECWDQRKSTATIYWVDAKADFPSNKVVPAGTPVELITRVTRSVGALPAVGWKVRYEILNPELASFYGTSGSSVVEAVVDDEGNAIANLVPTPGTSGTATIKMDVIRPGGKSDNLPTLTLGQGQTFVTWSSPKLTLRAGGPPQAGFNAPFTVYANVANPGDQPATNVRVDVTLPPGTQVINAGPDPNRVAITDAGVTWDIGQLPPQTQLDLSLEISATSSRDLRFVATADGLRSEDTLRVDIFRPSLLLAVEPVQARVEAGQPVTFNIDVTNTSDRALSNAKIVAVGDSSMIHESGDAKVEDTKPTPLQAGETWKKEIVFTPTTAGSRCINVAVTTDGGQRTSTQSCVIAINPIPQTPQLSARIDATDRMTIGQNVTITSQIANTGQGEAKNVVVEMVFDPQLVPIMATEGVDRRRVNQNVITWTVPSIPPGSSVPLAGEFRATTVTPTARVRVRAQDQSGATSNAELSIGVFPAAQAGPTNPPQNLPPASPTPSIPGDPAPGPLQGSPPPAVNPNPSLPQRSGRLQTTIVNRDNPVRVNDPIRYSLTITNDSNFQDSNIDIQFPLPDGVKLERLTPLTNPELGVYEIKNNQILLPYIPNLGPGESAQYELVLSSNQPQTFDLVINVRSDNQLAGYAESRRTTVVP